MKFSIVLFAGIVAASMGEYEGYSAKAPMATGQGPPELTTKVVYETKYHTVISCPSSVTDCPSDKTKVVTSVVAVDTTICPVSEATAKPSPPPKPANGTCDAYYEVCTTTVTAKKTWAANVTAPLGTGTPATPTKAYYSNAANSMVGGAFAVGAGALAALLL